MPPTLNAKEFFTLLQAKLLETQVEMSVLRQEYADKLRKIESKLGMILQATDQYEESSQNNNFLTPHSTLCMTFDGDKQPLVKSLKFESEIKFKIHLNILKLLSVTPGCRNITLFLAHTLNCIFVSSCAEPLQLNGTKHVRNAFARRRDRIPERIEVVEKLAVHLVARLITQSLKCTFILSTI
jgi:hypothetical protein